MGQTWDTDIATDVDLWREVFRVLVLPAIVRHQPAAPSILETASTGPRHSGDFGLPAAERARNPQSKQACPRHRLDHRQREPARSFVFVGRSLDQRCEFLDFGEECRQMILRQQDPPIDTSDEVDMDLCNEK